MEITNVTATAIVEKKMSLDVNDCVALGCAFAPFKELLAAEDVYQAWCRIPYDERHKKDENGNPIHPEPKSAHISTSEVVSSMRIIIKFIDKIAIYPSNSNVFE